MTLRGHCGYFNTASTSTYNPGIFLALLNFRIDSGDAIVKKHFSLASKNSQYCAKYSEWFDCCNLKMDPRANHTGGDKRGKIFSLSEQMRPQMQWTKNNYLLCLGLLMLHILFERNSFPSCYVVWAQQVLLTITSVLQTLGLDLRYLRGQGYDGSGNMAEKCKGAAAIIQRDYSKAIYVYCASHVLNLCIVTACGLPVNMHRILQEIYLFYAFSPKWQAELDKAHYSKLWRQ